MIIIRRASFNIDINNPKLRSAYSLDSPYFKGSAAKIV